MEFVEKKRSIYFGLSVAIAAVAGIPIYFLNNYFFYTHEHLWLTSDSGQFWVNLLVFPEISLYFVLFAVIAGIIGIRGSFRARIVWLAVLGEFLYIFLNILIFRVSVEHGRSILDPTNIAGIVLLSGSIFLGAVSLGIKRMRFEPASNAMIWSTTAFFALGILILIGIMVPFGFRMISALPGFNWSVPWAWGQIEVPPLVSALTLFSKTFFIVLLSLGIIVLVTKWRYGFLYASLVLFLFGLRWLEMIVPIFDTINDLRGSLSDSLFPFSYGPFYEVTYRMIYGVFHLLPKSLSVMRMELLVKAVMAIPSLVSFLLGFLFLFRIDKKTPRKRRG